MHEISKSCSSLAKESSQFIAVCSSAQTCAIGEHFLAVSKPRSQLQERLLHAGALVRPPPLQRRPGSSLHPDAAVARSPRQCLQKEDVRDDVHEKRAECLLSLRKTYLRVLRGLSQYNLPRYVSFVQFLRNFRHQKAFEPAEMSLPAA